MTEQRREWTMDNPFPLVEAGCRKAIRDFFTAERAAVGDNRNVTTVAQYDPDLALVFVEGAETMYTSEEDQRQFLSGIDLAYSCFQQSCQDRGGILPGIPSEEVRDAIGEALSDNGEGLFAFVRTQSAFMNAVDEQEKQHGDLGGNKFYLGIVVCFGVFRDHATPIT